MLKVNLTSVQRRLLSRTFLIGFLLTIAVAVVEQLDWLSPLENFFYDVRARRCQYFMPPPSKQIVHVNIDDNALIEIGRWPWPRDRVARCIDEIHAAGAKTIALDVMFAEPQEARLEKRPDGTVVTVIDDQILAEAMRRADNVLAPASAKLETKAEDSQIQRAMVEIFKNDLEADAEELERALAARPERFKDQDIKVAVRDEFLRMHERAMFARMEAMLHDGPKPLDQLLPSLTPKSVKQSQISDAVLTARTVYARLSALGKLHRFMLDIPPSAPRLLTALVEESSPPIPVLADAARYSGYVDIPTADDAIIRSIPLVAEFQGRLYPHMAFATALAALDVPFERVRVERNRIIVPRDNAPAIEIPIRDIESDRQGRVGAFLDLSWFGRTQDWPSLYDFPAHERPVQQISLQDVWKPQSLRNSILRNEEQALEAILFFQVELLNEQADPIRQRWQGLTSEQRIAEMQAVINDEGFVKPTYEACRTMTPAELESDPRYKVVVPSYQVLENAISNNKYLLTRITEARASLRQKLEGKVVMFGWTAAGAYDYYPTPLFSQCPGVVIQGVAVNTILTEHFWYRAPKRLGALLTLGMGAAVTVIVAFFSSYRALIATLLLAISYLAINAFVLFDYADLIVPAAGAMTACAVVWGILTLYRYIFESTERARITARFSGYVDPAIVNMLIEDPDKVRFDGEVREMTVVFTDLAGFTTISEKLQERTVPLLNDYMGRMMPIIRRNRGTWNKFLGDGIMFFYNAPRDNPNHARDAVLTVLQMQDELEDFNKSLFAQQLPKVAMRAGIVTGSMIAGDAGSISAEDQTNMASDYTVLGDNVNLSARLESANKALGSRVLMTERTVELMGNDILVRPMAKLQVVGKTQGVMTFEPLCLIDKATEQQKKLAEHSKRVVEAFVAGNFKECEQAARAMQDELGSSKFTQIYIEQSREYLLAPPEGEFDGTIILESK